MILSSEKFYNCFIDDYNKYSLERNNYISSVNNIIISRAQNFSSILDVGCGTGSRVKYLSDCLKIDNVTVVDNSLSMVNLVENNYGYKSFAVDIGNHNTILSKEKYQLILCLWNVFGHIGSKERCLNSLDLLSNIIDNDGLLIIDINNRYNINQYGLINVFKNIIKDIFNYNFKNGDFTLCVKASKKDLKTVVHIFNPFEMRKYIKKCGLKIDNEIYINYKSGKIVRSWLSGQIVYILKK